MRKIVSLILSLIILVVATIAPMAMAAPAQYNSDVSISASLDKASMPTCVCDRTVVLTVNTSKTVDLFSIGYEIEKPADWEIVKIESGSSAITFGNTNFSLEQGTVSWFGTNKSTDTIGKITFKVPANTPAGKYKIGVKSVELATANQNDNNAWMEGGTAVAECEIKSFEYSDVEILTKISEDVFLSESGAQRFVLEVYPSIPVGVFSVHYLVNIPESWKIVSIESGNDNLEYAGFSDTANKTVSWYDADNKYAETLGKITIEIPANAEIGEFDVGVSEVEIATKGYDSGNAWLSDGSSLKKVKVIELSELVIVTPATKLVYNEGENFDTTGMAMKIKYSDGTEVDCTNYTVVNGSNLKVGQTYVEYKITIANVTKTVKQAITVNQVIYPVTGISLDKSTLDLDKGDTYTLKATITPSNATDKTITWTSSDASIAKVDANGKVTALKAGTVTITAKAGSKTATCKVTVDIPVKSIKLDKTSVDLLKNETVQLNATIDPSDAVNQNVKWTSSDATIASVDSNGKVTALKSGNATITVTTEDGSKTATCAVSVTVLCEEIKLNKTSTTMKVGATEKISTAVKPYDATMKNLAWSSSDPSVVSVDYDGLLTAKKVGNAVITCSSWDGGATATVNVTVVASDIAVQSVSLDQTSATLEIGYALTLNVKFNPSNATNTNVTWTSSNTSVATVDEYGNVAAIAAGQAIITVKTEDGGKTAKCTITVKAAETTAPATDEPTATPVVTDEPTATPDVTDEPTNTPEVTNEPTATPEVTSEPTATPVPEEPSGCNNLWPLWIIIALAVVVIVIVVILVIKKKKNA